MGYPEVDRSKTRLTSANLVMTGPDYFRIVDDSSGNARVRLAVTNGKDLGIATSTDRWLHSADLK